MTRPDPRSNAAASAALSGAVDLSSLKARADASRQQSGGGSPSQQGSAGQAGAQTSAAVIDVTESSFQADVVERSMQVPVVVDLWADWCQPCKQLSPVLERLAAEAGGTWILAKVDVDANPRIAQVFGVQSIPMVVAIGGGQPVDAFQGALPESQIKQWLDTLLDSLRDKLPGIKQAENESATAAEAEEPEEDQRFATAEAAIERGDYAVAESAYQDILASEPDNEQATAALAQVRFAARAAQHDPDAVARADAAPGDVDAQIAAAEVELAGQRVEDAFRRLIGTVSQQSGQERDRAREHLIGLFDLFPADDPRVAAARRDLASALF